MGFVINCFKFLIWLGWKIDQCNLSQCEDLLEIVSNSKFNLVLIFLVRKKKNSLSTKENILLMKQNIHCPLIKKYSLSTKELNCYWSLLNKQYQIIFCGFGLGVLLHGKNFELPWKCN